MDPERWERVKDLFEIGEPMSLAEREQMLAREPDSEIRDEAARLLKINPVHALIDRPVMSPKYLDGFTANAALLGEGELLGTRYKIERRVASGGMGDVYAAYDNELRERIAIKTIRPDIIANPAIVARFRREITLARRVSHPNVCRVFDLSRDERSSDGRMVDFLTMELVEGETLSQLLKREAPMGFETARPLLEQICAGLAAAHDAGVVHRDFKGSNVLISKRPNGTLRAAVTDFGLARSVSISGATHESSTGLAGGTPAYMAPEQMEGRTVGPKADLYALGIVMYEMATGTAPHTGDSPLQIAVRRVTERPQAPRQVNPDIDPRWEEAILRCLEYKPEDRPADARAVVELFGHAPPLFTVPRWRRMPRWLMPGLVGAGLAVLAALWMYTRPPVHSEEALRWYRKGTDSLLDGSYSSARASFEQALTHEPGFGLAQARLADTFFELDMPDESRTAIAKAVSNDRNEQLLIDGTRFALERKFPDAIERMDTLVSRKRSAETLLDRARVLDKGYRTDEAIAAYQAVLERDAAIPGALLRLSAQLSVKGKKKEAAEALDRAEKAYVGDVEGRASVLLEKAKFENRMEAAEALAKEARELAVQAGSDTLQVRAMFAQCVYAARAGDSKRAEALAAEATEFAKKTGQAAAAAAGLKDLAYIPYSKRDYKAAIPAYREALNVAERYNSPRRVAEIKRSLGDSLARGGDVDAGMMMIREALRFHEANGDTLEALNDRLLLADCDSVAQRYDLGFEGYRAVLADAKKTPGAERLTMRVQESVMSGLYVRGEYPEAVALGKEALAFFQKTGEKPHEMYVRYNLAASLRHLGRLDEARAVLAPAVSDPSNPYLDLAVREQENLLRDSGDLQQSIALMEKARVVAGDEKGPGDSWARGLCLAYSLTDRIQQAEKWCLPLIAITSESSNLAGLTSAAMFRIQAAKGRWNEAMGYARKLREWAEVHHDPELGLLSHLMVAVASSEGGRKPADPEALARWKKERKALADRWGESNVAGMLTLPAFRMLERQITAQ